jgi:hypothetical protein
MKTIAVIALFACPVAACADCKIHRDEVTKPPAPDATPTTDRKAERLWIYRDIYVAIWKKKAAGARSVSVGVGRVNSWRAAPESTSSLRYKVRPERITLCHSGNPDRKILLFERDNINKEHLVLDLPARQARIALVVHTPGQTDYQTGCYNPTTGRLLVNYTHFGGPNLSADPAEVLDEKYFSRVTLEYCAGVER